MYFTVFLNKDDDDDDEQSWRSTPGMGGGGVPVLPDMSYIGSRLP